MAKKVVAKKPVVAAKSSSANKNKNLSIVALIINLFIPGLGSVIGGETRIGVMQLVLYLISYPLMMVFVGFVTIIVAWVWALMTSIKLVKEA
ncbi:hypothetical protein J4409_00740 [Candidatus Woesearchaeota archaeon]|nr:hypothetical protein [Candidatus Woesearchaeota archaeon]